MNVADKDGYTPIIHVATHLENYNCLHHLLNAGADVNRTDTYGRTALMVVIQYKKLEIIELIINAGTDVNKTDKHGSSALIGAADRGRHNVLGLLIDAGADVNFINKLGFTAVIRAAMDELKELPTEWLKCVKILLKSGAIVFNIDFGVTHLSIISMRQYVRHRRHKSFKPIRVLMLVAGEQFCYDGDFARDFVRKNDKPLCLRHMCRRTIRNYLMELKRVNLFFKVYQLDLPRSLASFLVYDMSLDYDDNDHDKNNLTFYHLVSFPVYTLGPA